jgi:hypothetical protein
MKSKWGLCKIILFQYVLSSQIGNQKEIWLILVIDKYENKKNFKSFYILAFL